MLELSEQWQVVGSTVMNKEYEKVAKDQSGRPTVYMIKILYLVIWLLGVRGRVVMTECAKAFVDGAFPQNMLPVIENTPTGSEVFADPISLILKIRVPMAKEREGSNSLYSFGEKNHMDG